MGEVLYAAIGVVIPICVFTIPVGCFNVKMFKSLRGYKCTGIHLLYAFLPFVNILYSRGLLLGKTIYTPLLCVCGAMLVFRGIALALIMVVPELIVYSAFAVLMAVITYYVLYTLNILNFCSLLQCSAGLTVICALVAPLGYYMVSTQVEAYFHRTEDQLSGRFESTY